MAGIVSVLEHVSIASLACYKHAMNDGNCILINFKVLLKPNLYLSGNIRLWALRFDESFHLVSLIDVKHRPTLKDRIAEDILTPLI